MIEMIEPGPASPLSNRWEPGHVTRRDTKTGLFEQINSPCDTLVEMHIQHALINRPVPSNLDRLWNQKRC